MQLAETHAHNYQATWTVSKAGTQLAHPCCQVHWQLSAKDAEALGNTCKGALLPLPLAVPPRPVIFAPISVLIPLLLSLTGLIIHVIATFLLL